MIIFRSTTVLTCVLTLCLCNAQVERSMQGAFGAVTIDGKVWNQIALRPIVPLGKFAVALDLVFYFDQDGNVHQDEWDFSSPENTKNTIIDKIYYIRYGYKNDPLYFKIGSLDRVDLGYGILVNSYSNAIQYPQVRKVGLDYRIKTKLGTIEGFVNDFKENIGLTGLRVKSPFISSLPFAVSIVIDRNQYLGLRDGDSDGVPDIVDAFPNNSAFSMDSDNDGLADLDPNELDRDGDGYLDAGNLDDIHAWWDNLGNTVGVDFSNESYYDSLPDGNIVLDSDPLNINKNADPVGAIAVDFGYPLITQEKLSVNIYSQAAKMIGKTMLRQEELSLGTGLVPLGVSTVFGPAKLKIEYRMIPKGQFEFGYWNRSYQIERASFSSVDNIGMQVITKESRLGRYGKQNGYYASLNLRLGSFFRAGAAYQDLTGEIWSNSIDDFEENKNKNFVASLSLTKSISKIKYARWFYQQRNVPNPFKFEPSESTVMGYRIGVDLGSGMILNYSFQRTYRDLNGDGKVNGPNEMINITSIETSFNF